MTGAQYVLGVALTVGTIASVTVAAVALQRRIVPSWRGGDAVLADVVLAVVLLLLITEILGTFGQFRRWPVVAACVAVGAAVTLACRQRGPRVRAADAPPSDRAAAGALVLDTRRPGITRAALIALPVLAVGLVVAQWSAHVVHSYGHGILDGDSIWYHLPFAARFLQTGWTSRLHFMNADALVTFFPANSELLNATLLLPFHRDLLIPVVNLFWLGVALLAGWCIGARFRAGAVGTAAVALVTSLPLVASTQGGTARNDVMAIAVVVAAVALLLRAEWEPWGVVLAGLAAGLALGTKLNLIAPVGLLTVGVLVVAPRRHGLRTRALWLAALVVSGGYWYARNLAHTGNPLPWLSLHLGPLHLRADPGLAADVKNSTLVEHLGDNGLWSKVVHPGLHLAFGSGWWVVLALAGVGAITALVTRREPHRMTTAMIAVVVAVAVVAYLFTPNSATGGSAGSPGLLGAMFLLNLRYVLPALTLGIALLSAAPAMSRPVVRLVTLGVIAAVVVANQFPRGLQHYGFEWKLTGRDVVIGLVVAACLVAAAAAARSISMSRIGAASAVVGAVVVAVALGWPLQHHYADRRYRRADVTLPIGAVFPWAQGVRGARIGLTGDVFQYPLYGPDLSNHVQYVGVTGPRGAFEDATTCSAWYRVVRRGGYDYLVLARSFFDPVGSLAVRQQEWTARIPGASTLVDEHLTRVVRVGARAVFPPCT